MSRLFLIIASSLTLFPLAAQAQVEARPMLAPTMLPGAGPCALQESASINVSYHNAETELSSIKTKFDSKVSEIYKLSKQVSVEKLVLTNLNYSVNPQEGSLYMVNGNLNFNVLPPAKATALMVLLTQKGYSVNLSVNAYNNSGEGCAIDLQKLPE